MNSSSSKSSKTTDESKKSSLKKESLWEHSKMKATSSHGDKKLEKKPNKDKQKMFNIRIQNHFPNVW